MLVTDIMTTDVFAVAPDTSLETAARLLTTKHITGAPVVTNGKPIGVVTLSDLVNPDRLASAHHGYPLFYRIGGDESDTVGDFALDGEGVVSDVMSPFVLAIDSSAAVEEAGARLVSEEVHRLLVIDRQKLVGIVSSLDVIRGMLRRGP